VARGLRAERFALDVAHDGNTGWDFAARFDYDIVILDLMLPGLSGTELLGRLRKQNSRTPVLILTARDATADKVRHFDAGADDYLTKPFAFAELLVRVRALLRRGPINQSSVLRVADPGEFIKQIAGTNAQFQTEDIDGQLKRAIVTEFSDALGEMKIPALDLAAQYKELGGAIRDKINEDFKGYGLEVTKFYVENISLPPEVEAALDKRASMGALGDAQKYMQFQAADALRDAAKNEGGGAGLGAGLGAGFAVGGQMANAFGQQAQGGQAGAATVACPSCGKQNNPQAKFCADCGGKMEAVKVPCVKCGAQLREGAKFCSECGSSQEKAKCSNCQAELAPGAKFCPECGTKTEA
jgi:membrane protease subunit (stomatin/prohibitin family)